MEYSKTNKNIFKIKHTKDHSKTYVKESKLLSRMLELLLLLPASALAAAHPRHQVYLTPHCLCPRGAYMLNCHLTERSLVSWGPGCKCWGPRYKR